LRISRPLILSAVEQRQRFSESLIESAEGGASERIGGM